MSSRAVLFAVVALAATLPGAAAQGTSVQATRGRTAEPSSDEIIRRFAAAESELRDARGNYLFKQDVTIEQLVQGGSAVTGVYRRVSEILFDDKGQRLEKITYFPQPTLTQFTVGTEDLQDLGIIQPFALTTEDLPKYTIRPAGRERLDEIDTYVFDVAPRDPAGMAKRGERYFTGRVWVENEDYMIVKVAGQAGPESKNKKFPHFETYRENIDGKYWFPTYTYCDDILAFPQQDVHMRMIVHYRDYKQFTGNITIDEGSEQQVEPDHNPSTPPPTQPKKP